MPISPNTTLAHYRIISKIGSGGMGDVYCAYDTKLDRKVAIKFLSDQFSKDHDKLKRFIQEAKAASALNHPNILTVYEIGEVEGKHYIATELIDGQTLRQQLSHTDPLPLKNVLRIGEQVAEALSAAHAAGIIHRDIKPENIMIRHDGYAKVLDFGLAKLSEPEVGHGVAADTDAPTRVQIDTNPGVVMGTVFYMSPEQTLGNATDARTDIWSLGVVLYEMIAGRVPFSGDTTSHTIVAILEKEPRLTGNAPPELCRIIRKALSKEIDMRYQSTRDLLIDLKNLHRELDLQGELERSTVNHPKSDPISENETRTFSVDPVATHGGGLTATQGASSLEYALTQAKSHKLAIGIAALLLLGVVATAGYFLLASKRSTSTGQINSIAVMPFVNASGNNEVEYLSDGITDSLIFRFSQLPNVKVSPTSSVMRFKGTSKSVADVAKELDVDAVLTGRLMQVGDNLSISVQLVDARSQKLVWAEKYDRKMADLLATQREIATTLTEKMQLRLAGDERGLNKKYTSSNDAYQLYLKGQYHWERRTKADMLKAIDCYNEAISLDPKFALAYAATAQVYNSMGKNPDVAPKDCIPLAKAAAQRALEIDPELPQGHSALGDSLALYDWNWSESEREFKRALELDPNIGYTHVAYGLDYLAAVGKRKEMVAELEKAVELEPLSMINNAVLVSAYINDHQYDKALSQARLTFDLDSNFPFSRHWLGFALIVNGKADEAIAAMQPLMPEAPFGWMSVVIVGHAYAKLGKRVEAEQQIALLRELGKTRYVRSYYLASIYATLGDKDKAFAELERSVEERDCYLGRMSVDPFMDPLRDDPRFNGLLKRMNL